ncbi:MAG: hypothetical protein ACT4OT_07255 [Acidobacteriota bacterium]
MKRCPKCNRTYADDTIAFCLADGALLSAPYDPDATLRFPQPKTTLQSPVEPWPGDGRGALQSDRPNNSKFVYVAVATIALIMAGGIAIWLILDQKRSSEKESPTSASVTSTPNTIPSPAPSSSLSADKPSPKVEASPTPANSPDLSYLTGPYNLYRLENPSSGLIGTMTLRVRRGSDIFVQGADWTGTGKIDGKQGYYDWKFEDGKHGRTTVLVNDDGTLQGRVFGSGIDWWYLARRQR